MWTSEAGIEQSMHSLRVSSTWNPTEQAHSLLEYKPRQLQLYPVQHHFQ